MKYCKSSGYINYGLIPKNEYTAANPEKSTDAVAALEYDPGSGDTAYGQRLMKWRAQHPSGRRKIRGWSRTRKVNGWRAESASLHDEFEYTGMGGYSHNVRNSNRPL